MRLSFSRWAFRVCFRNTTTTTAFTFLALFASVTSLGYQIWRTGLVQAADLLMRFEQNFFGPDKVKQRSLAATNLLKNPPDFKELEDILDFFKTIAMLTRKRALNLDMVSHTFAYWIERYYEAARTYIQQRQVEEPAVWEDLTWLSRKVEAYRRQKRGKLSAVPLDATAVATFLHEEAAEA